MATVNEDKNDVPTELKSSSSNSSVTILKKESKQVDSNDPPNELNVKSNNA